MFSHELYMFTGGMCFFNMKIIRLVYTVLHSVIISFFCCCFFARDDVFLKYFHRMERDADFLHKKAERATLRVCLREKYRLPKVRVTLPLLSQILS